MKNVFRRIMVLVLALTMLATVMLPAAMAAEQEAVSNSSGKIYAGMSDTIVVWKNGVMQNNRNYKWSSSNSKVVSVNSYGVIRGMKAGKAKITFTRKSNSREKGSMTITVKKNKVSNLNYKPAAASAPYMNGTIRLKSVEIVSPTQVVAEYYLAFNLPSSWRVTKINWVEDAINLFSRDTGALAAIIVGDSKQLTSKNISGFKPRKGRFVQTVKVTYSGGRVHCSDILLSNYIVNDSSNVRFNYSYTH